MKSKWFRFLVSLIVLVLSFSAESSETGKSLTEGSPKKGFHFLTAYGEWLEVAPYGVSWKPSVISSWHPFEYGRWIWSERGWTWLSYEPFGWIICYYGNWIQSFDHGWIWVPGYDWSPAQVTWIRFGQSIAWSPAPPGGAAAPAPWESPAVGLWKIVQVSDFDRDDIRSHIAKVNPLRPEETVSVLRKPPELEELQSILNRQIEKVPVILRKEQNLQRIDFPVDVNNRIAAYKNNVSMNIIRQKAPKAGKKTSLPENERIQKTPVN